MWALSTTAVDDEEAAADIRTERRRWLWGEGRRGARADVQAECGVWSGVSLCCSEWSQWNALACDSER